MKYADGGPQEPGIRRIVVALAWMRQHRRMSKDHERLPESSEAFI